MPPYIFAWGIPFNHAHLFYTHAQLFVAKVEIIIAAQQNLNAVCTFIAISDCIAEGMPAGDKECQPAAVEQTAAEEMVREEVEGGIERWEVSEGKRSRRKRKVNSTVM